MKLGARSVCSEAATKSFSMMARSLPADATRTDCAAGSGTTCWRRRAWVDVPDRSSLALFGMSVGSSLPSRQVSFSLASSEPARLEVYDTAGRRLLVREARSARSGPASDRIGGSRGRGRQASTSRSSSRVRSRSAPSGACSSRVARGTACTDYDQPISESALESRVDPGTFASGQVKSCKPQSSTAQLLYGSEFRWLQLSEQHGGQEFESQPG